MRNNIEVTEHVCLRFCERINPNLLSVTDYRQRLIMAERAIKGILKDAIYVSDDHRGVLLHSTNFSCNLIVKNKKLITIYLVKNKK